MRYVCAFVFLFFGYAFLGNATPAAAGSGVTCRSVNHQYQHCHVDARGEVRLDRQLSDAPCIRGRTWGQDRQGIWVDKGCQAKFELEEKHGHGHRRHGRESRDNNVITCRSEDYKHKHCRVRTDGVVRLERQLSDARCVRGRTWGQDQGGIWVDRGCQAQFVIEEGRRGGYPDSAQSDLITCKSKNYRRNICYLRMEGDAQLVRKLSDAPCIEGRTWGQDGRGIWVDNGCHAEFAVNQRGAPPLRIPWW
jgi:hypothetical protein